MSWNHFLDLFEPTLPLLEPVIRGSIIYLFLFAIFRVFRRQGGSIAISDLLLLVLIADAAQNALASEYKSITEGAILISTLVFWDFFIDWLSFRFTFFRGLADAEPLLLVQDGVIIRKNMEKELITKDELFAQLRQQGVESLNQVKQARIEGDGHLSVIKKEKIDSPPQKSSKKKRVHA